MAPVRRDIRFLLNDHPVRLADAGACDTLLDYLRLERRLCGTKEGCAEGDCGACTVLIGRRREDGLVYETVNACIRLLPSVDCCHVVTVEHLANRQTAADDLHPVQRAMVDRHGSQCGFCTPGIVMSLYGLWMTNPVPTEEDIETALQGNLCRCTGYQPIIAAALEAANTSAQHDALVKTRTATAKTLADFDDGARVDVCGQGSAMGGAGRAILPASVDDLAAVREELPQSTIIAGGTDVALQITKALLDVSPVVFVGHLEELRRIESDSAGITIGAGASYSDCAAVMAREFPHLTDFWNRIGGWQIRNAGTIGGNIANASPIGDTAPALMALGATLTMRTGAARRRLPLEEFFVAAGKQDRRPGDFIESIHIPRSAAGALNGAYKVSKRRDEDIAAVCGAFHVSLADGAVAAARIAFGGMAATPKRAPRTERALTGQPWSEAVVRNAAAQLAHDFTPISDWRASARYRALVAGNLLRRFYLENAGADHPETRSLAGSGA